MILQTNYKTFVPLEDYDGETVTFLGATKTMGEWAVLISDVLDSEEPSPFDNRVNFGPDGGVTDWAENITLNKYLKSHVT